MFASDAVGSCSIAKQAEGNEVRYACIVNIFLTSPLPPKTLAMTFAVGRKGYASEISTVQKASIYFCY